MKLNKSLRTTILDSVMGATTFEVEKKSIIKRTSDLARGLIAAQVPAEFVQLAQGHPREWFASISGTYLNMDEAPEMVFDAPNRYIQFDPVLCPTIFPHKLSDEDRALFAPLRVEAEALVKRINDTRGELQAFLNSCTTTEKIIARMPELEPYISKTAVSYPLVASTSNLLSCLLKSGFIVQPASHT